MEWQLDGNSNTGKKKLICATVFFTGQHWIDLVPASSLKTPRDYNLKSNAAAWNLLEFFSNKQHVANQQ
jgi:hypothetical protein